MITMQESCCHCNIKAWFPHGRKHVVTVVEIDSFSISMTFTTLLRHIHDHMETRLKVHARGVCEARFHCSMVREQGSLSNSLHL